MRNWRKSTHRDAIAINDQLALVAARQVEVVRQAIARIVVVPVAFVVHARPSVVAVPLAVLAWGTPSASDIVPPYVGAAVWVCP